jgi:hypothetical protein
MVAPALTARPPAEEPRPEVKVNSRKRNRSLELTEPRFRRNQHSFASNQPRVGISATGAGVVLLILIIRVLLAALAQ